MNGVHLTGEELMKSLNPGQRIDLKIVESYSCHGNVAILLDDTLYVSKAAQTLIYDPEVSEDAFKGLIIYT